MSFIPLQSVDPVVAWTLAPILIEIEGITYLNRSITGPDSNRIRIRCSECGEHVAGRIKTLGRIGRPGIELVQCEVCDGIICPARQVPLSRVIYWTGEGAPPPVKKRQVVEPALHKVLQAAKTPPAPGWEDEPTCPRCRAPSEYGECTRVFGHPGQHRNHAKQYQWDQDAALAPAKPQARMQGSAPIRRFTKDFGK